MMNESLQSDSSSHRTLAAIVFTDAVSFSARMSQNEEHTLILIKRDLQMMTNICIRFEGQVLKSTGDGLLMYFASATNAVACAVEIQKAIKEASARLSSQDILTHRIGIHLGDVFISDNDVMGNGVNIAARLQTEAEPGGICISHTVYEVVKNSLALKTVYLGAKELKNISEAVQIYQILTASEVSEKKVCRKKADDNRKANLQEIRTRQVLLSKVKNYWIRGVLESSLHDRAMIELGAEERPESLKRPWEFIWNHSGKQSLSSNISISEKFDELGRGRTLLILGEPGSGKTTTLLELAKHLIEKAEQNSELPAPTVFNLSSWRMDKPDIADWLVQELHTKYQVSKDLGKSWIQEQHLLLLLDGLDEVRSGQQDACVSALNRFIADYGETEIAVCSRIRDYERLSDKLQFQAAVYIRPLTQTQIQEYLANFGDSLVPLRNILSADPVLQEFAQSPLMLNIMAIAYQNMPADELSGKNAEDMRSRLFNTYIERMFDRRGVPAPDREQTVQWLAWLAKYMTEESQTVFLIERMQPKCLEAAKRKWMYSAGIGMICALILAGGSELFIVTEFGLPNALTLSLLFGLTGGIIGCFLGVKVLNLIEPVESIKWSWEKAKKSIPLSIWIGLGVGLLYGFGIGGFNYFILQIPVDLDVMLMLAIKNTFGVSLIFMLLRGLSGSGIETNTAPNYGIRQSFYNAAFFTSVGLITLVISAKFIGYNVLPGIVLGSLVGIFSPAGIACIQHFSLRSVLYFTGFIPLNYAKFLDYAAQLVFLQKVGGGYIFIHRLLTEHFARMLK